MGKNSLVNRGDLIGTFFKEALCFVPSVLALIFLTGCVSSASTKTQGFTSIPSTASIPVLPATATIIPSPTFTSTPIFTPTPTHPSLPAPVVPNVSANISVDNVSKLTRVISLGEGDLMNIQLSPDGKWIVLGTENGVLVLDSTTLAKVLFLPTAMKPKIISFIDNDNKLTATDCYTGNVWTFPDGKLISHVHFNWMNPNQYSLSCTSIPDSNWEYAFGTTESEYNHGAPSESKAGLYRLIDGKIQYTVNYQAGNFSISPDSKLVALKTPDKLVIIQYQDGKVIQEIPGTGIKSVFFIPDGKTLVTVFQNKIEFRSVGDFHLIDTIVAYNIRSYFLSPDSSILVIIRV